MIVPKGWQFWRMLAYLGWPLLLLAIWDVAIVLAYNVLHWEWVGSKEIPLALYGSAIGIIVGFRNNSAYARWWEARQLWGQIVNNSRSVARQVCSTITPARREESTEQRLLQECQQTLVYHQIAFAHALRQHLRGLSPWEALEPFLSPEDLERLRGEKNVPLAIQQAMGVRLREAKDKGWIDALEWQAIDQNINDLTDAQGGAERIKNTPLPKQYDYYPMLFVRIYCVLLPVGAVEQLGWLTPLGSTIVGFMILALDKIGRDLEDPFDNSIYDVPMTAIATTIEINLRQLLGEKELPSPVTVVKGVLW